MLLLGLLSAAALGNAALLVVGIAREEGWYRRRVRRGGRVAVACLVAVAIACWAAMVVACPRY